MKNLKKLSVLFVACLFMFVGLTPTKAASVVGDGVMMDSNGQPFFVATDSSKMNQYYWAKLKTTDGTVVYCRDIDKTWPSDQSGTSYKDEIDPMDAGLIYILQQSNSNPTDRERFVTQGAIWLYVTGNSNFSPAYTDTYNLLPEMLNLVNGANQAKASGNVSHGTINGIGVLSNEMVLSEDGSYYISDKIVPSVSGVATYDVSVSGVNGAVVTNLSGATQSTFNAGDSFLVKVPANTGDGKEVTVNVSIRTKAHMISPVGNSGYQRVIGLSINEKTIVQSVKLTTAAKVCVNYVIVGDVRPDASLTDPTPEKKCYDRGIFYNQEKELTTRTNCKFNGWYTKEVLTGKWVDGTALNNNLTLYGAWECPTNVIVPPTAAGTSLIIIGASLILVSGATGFYLIKEKKAKK